MFKIQLHEQISLSNSEVVFITISELIRKALIARAARTGDPIEVVVEMAIASSLDS